MSSSCSATTATTVGIPQGLLFGILLQKSRMSQPQNIKNQMHLLDWGMMKTFLAASGSSTLSLALLNLLGVATLSPFNINWKGNLIGGAVMGVGMTLGGACPGTVLAQIGEGIISAPYTLLGGLLGAASYAFVNSSSSLGSLFSSQESSGSFNTLNGLLGVNEMWKIGLPFGGMLIGIALFLESLFPTKKQETSRKVEGNLLMNLMKKKEWHPIYSGLALGSLQIPVNLFVGAYLSTSSAFVTVAGMIVKNLPIVGGGGGANNQYFKKHSLEAGAKYVWQLVADMSIIVGSYISSSMSGEEGEKKKKLTMNEKMMAVGSGFLLLFGARIANGCTSGHGLSQMANLSFAGMLTIASMMASGMGLGLALNRLRK